MHIWLITVGEPLPIDDSKSRLLRTGILANLLVKNNHKVVWWTSTFDHTKKKHRFSKNTSIELSENFKIKLLHSLGYKKNISIGRIIDHYGLARQFNELLKSESQPDIILCSLPTIELSLAATEYGIKYKVPVVLDVRDLWPDIFLELVPKWGQRLAKLPLLPMFNTVRSACAKATAISGNTSAFVDWGVNYAGRERSKFDRDFPVGYSEVRPDEEDIVAAKQFWKTYGLQEDSKEFICSFFGTLSHQFDIETIIKAAQKLKERNRLFRFILCGSGENLDYYKSLANNCDNITFPGWIGKAEIWTLMRMSSVGLTPYINIQNFTSNLPNKPIEYLSASLPIVSSLRGVLEKLLSIYNCGLTYENSNINDLVSILTNLYDNPEQLMEMSKNAKVLYESRFVAEKVYSDMLNHLESICNNYLTN